MRMACENRFRFFMRNLHNFLISHVRVFFIQYKLYTKRIEILPVIFSTSFLHKICTKKIFEKEFWCQLNVILVLGI